MCLSFRHFGYALIIGMLFSWLVGAWIVVANRMPDFKISFNGETISMIGMVFLAAWIIDIGRELYVDAEYTI